MSEFATDSFDIAIDKSTIDALLCGDDYLLKVALMLKETQRILRPGGHYFAISYGKPENRRSHFIRGFLSWTRREFILYKEKSANELEKKEIETEEKEIQAEEKQIEEENKEVDEENKEAEEEKEQEENDEPGDHWIYVCQKQPDGNEIAEQYFAYEF